MSNLQKLLCAELTRQMSIGADHDVRIPAGGELLWKWFMALHKTRQAGMAGPQPFTYAEISAYAHLCRQAIEPRHVDILMAMDQTYLNAAYDKQAPSPAGVKVLPPISKAPITAGLIDAMFGGV
jgi:hypothetical protein